MRRILAIGFAAIVIAIASFAPALLQSQVDCVSPGRVYALRMRGIVVDPKGAPIPGAKVSIESNGSVIATTLSNDDGRFSLNGKRGIYTLRVEYPTANQAFDNLSVELHAGTRIRTLLKPGQLRVILGIRYMFCTWVTTSRNEFEYEVRSNNGRWRDSEQKNATQK